MILTDRKTDKTENINFGRKGRLKRLHLPAFLLDRCRLYHLWIFTAESCADLPWSSEIFLPIFCGDRLTWLTGILCFKFWNAFSKSNNGVFVPGDMACEVMLLAKLFNFWDFPSWEFKPNASLLRNHSYLDSSLPWLRCWLQNWS